MTSFRRKKRAHPASETLALIVEEGAPDPRVAEHLAQCPRCVAIYGELLRARRLWLTDPDVRSPDRDLVELGLTVGRQRSGAAWSFFRTTRFLVFATPAVALLVAGSIAVFLSGRPGASDPGALSGDTREWIVERIRDDSDGGLFYSEEMLPKASTKRGRGGGSSPNVAVGEAIAAYESTFAREGQVGAADAAYWLVGALLASGQLREAAPYLDESLRRFPDDARLHNLAAILCYKQNDLAGAERELRVALGIERSALALVNLAIIRRDQGFEDEAHALIAEARARFPDSPLPGASPAYLRVSPQ